MFVYFTTSYLVFVGIQLVVSHRFFGRDYSDHDRVIFPDDNDDYPNGFDWNQISRTTKRPRTTTVPVPGMATRRSPCEERCQITPQYSPVCGTNDMTYSNLARLLCAKRCGKRVNLGHYGVCTSSILLFRP